MSTSGYREFAPTAIRLDEEYDYQPTDSTTPTRASAEGLEQMKAYRRPGDMQVWQDPIAEDVKGGEEALLDLAQLEELQQEAERMKALGNKHMAAQEYTRAYNAYSAALQLAPVGPSSHVFLSNRAAALLSLKRYQAAATDARRAIACAPTFGKAHARLGQALYFQKDYNGAVAAYSDALEYEPDNAVTQTYLDKAQYKLDKVQRRDAESVSGDTHMTPAHSIFTDRVSPEKMNTAVIRQTAVYSSRSALVSAAAAREFSPLDNAESQDDPDFEHALRIHQRANSYLTKKQYKSAIEEYTAALFLVPDDIHLSPDLHLGRAHALNGTRRHEGARNDCFLAIKLNPSPAAYSTLAKSLFYMREYSQAIDAFEQCQRLLPRGESLGVFDQAYLEKAKVAMEDEEYSLKEAGTVTSKSSMKSVPKLRPPRFVPREEALQTSPQVPAMPKTWPQQSPTSSTFHCGEERTVVFGSEALGVKLNRGSDGIVRVLLVTPATPGSPFLRKGDLHIGDVVREAAGVDLRRPLTNIMWGDTVALIKLAPRPIILIVAEELSPVPIAVLQEQERELAQWPSRSSGDEAVDTSTHVEIERVHSLADDVSSDEELQTNSTDVEKIEIDDAVRKEEFPLVLMPFVEESARDKEERMLGGDVLFTRTSPPAYNSWDTLRWMSFSGIRRLQFSQPLFRLTQSEKMNLFWKTSQEVYIERELLIYEEPALILIVRRAENTEELVEILDLPSAEIDSDILQKFWVAESVIDLSTCKIGLSPMTSFALPLNGSDRMQSCFTLFTPLESILLSAAKGPSYCDSKAFSETVAVEIAISKAICAAHGPRNGTDKTWRHQLILGTIHALVVSGKLQDLEDTILVAKKKYECEDRERSLLPTEIVDRVDENGLSALQLACLLNMPAAAKALVSVGANTSVKTLDDESTLAHLCVRNLDDSCLSTVFSVHTGRMNPNSFTSFGRSPMYTAIMEGRKAGRFDAGALGRCLLVLTNWGGEMGSNETREVVQCLAYSFRHADLSIVLQYCPFRFPLPTNSSTSAFYGYPLHHSIVCLQTAALVLLSSAVPTISVLLNHGFEPNERMDFLLAAPDGFASEYIGYTPLQILTSAGSDIERGEELLDDDEFSLRMKCIENAADLLLRNGGRIAVDHPFRARLRSSDYVLTQDSNQGCAPQKDYDFSTTYVFKLFGGKDRVNAARDEFISYSAVSVTPLALINSYLKLAIPNDGQPGGNDEKSCAICWKVFGTIRNRQHRCRISRRYVCDECSSKRLKDESTEHRISDGQFLLARLDAVRAEQASLVSTQIIKITASPVFVPAVNVKTRAVQDDSQNRESLFGGMMEKASNLVFGEDDQSSASGGLGGITSKLNETRDALNERGQKIDSLAEKSEKMVEASANFADMAKELRKKSEGGLFW